MQNYLGRIVARAEQSKSVVVLKINSVATSPFYRFVLSFSGVEGLFCCRGGGGSDDAIPSRFCTVFPETKYREDMMQALYRRTIRLPPAAAKAAAASSASAD
jgi:hypothetical protein